MRAALIAVLSTALALGAVTPAEARARPNILVIVTDDQRNGGTLGVMPATRSRLVREGRRFDPAFSNNPLCCPARSTLLSGQYSHNHGQASNDPLTRPLSPRRMFPRLLRRAGYRTGIVGKFLNNWRVQRDPPGFDEWWSQGGLYYGARWNVNGRMRRVPGYATTYTSRRSRGFIRRAARRRGRPWFLYVSTLAPHGPIRVERRYRSMPVGPHPRTPPMRQRGLSGYPPAVRDGQLSIRDDPSYHREVRRAQLRALRSVDDMVRDLFATLRRVRQARNTLVIYTSDQGLFWGERGGLGVKDVPYDEATRVPLMLRWPGRVRPGTDRRLAGHVDVAPTILDAARVRRRWTMDGRSLLRRWRRGRILLEYGGFRSLIPRWGAIRTRSAQYTEWYDVPGSGRESLPRGGSTPSFRELFDLRRDPFQMRNRLRAAQGASPSELPERARRLAGMLARDLGCKGRSCP